MNTKNMKNFLVTLLFAILVGFSTSKKSYDGHEVWRVNIRNYLDKTYVKSISDAFRLDIWSDSNSFVDLHVRPQAKHHVRTALANSKLQYNIMIPNVGKLIKDQEAKRLASKSVGIAFDQYNSLEDIEAYLVEVSDSNSNATLRSIGQTVEGREIWQIKFSVGSGKPAAWFDCNIHAREWITGATCVYGINLLSTSYGSDPNVTALLDKYDVYVIAIINPDGYSYTWSDDRMWRKNRNKYEENACYGIDLNRNFDDHFGGAGTSGQSCAETYRGPSPASEPETQATQAAILDLVANADLKVLFSLHSYSELWMYAYGYTSDLTPDADELDRVAVTGVKALAAVHGTVYEYGPISTTIYPASGNTVDFSYNNGVLYSYTLELRDTGDYGFLLPEDQIIPTAEETWAGLIAATLATK